MWLPRSMPPPRPPSPPPSDSDEDDGPGFTCICLMEPSSVPSPAVISERYARLREIVPPLRIPGRLGGVPARPRPVGMPLSTLAHVAAPAPAPTPVQLWSLPLGAVAHAPVAAPCCLPPAPAPHAPPTAPAVPPLAPAPAPSPIPAAGHAHPVHPSPPAQLAPPVPGASSFARGSKRPGDGLDFLARLEAVEKRENERMQEPATAPAQSTPALQPSRAAAAVEPTQATAPAMTATTSADGTDAPAAVGAQPRERRPRQRQHHAQQPSLLGGGARPKATGAALGADLIRKIDAAGLRQKAKPRPRSAPRSRPRSARQKRAVAAEPRKSPSPAAHRVKQRPQAWVGEKVAPTGGVLPLAAAEVPVRVPHFAQPLRRCARSTKAVQATASDAMRAPRAVVRPRSRPRARPASAPRGHAAQRCTPPDTSNIAS